MTEHHPARTPDPGLTPPAAPESAPPAARLAYSVDEAASLTGLSRDLLYDEMRRGHLHYLKIGRRRLITRQHLQEFLGIVPPATDTPASTPKAAADAP